MILALVLGVNALYAGKGKVRIASDKEGAYIYVDGKKKAMTGEGFTSILLEEGDHTVKVVKEVDGIYEYTQTKQIFVGEDSSVKYVFKLKRQMTVQGKVAEEVKLTRWRRSGSTVTDKKLGLEWQDSSEVKSNNRKWSLAKSYCSNLTLAGHRDWRLPTYDELLTIVDYDRYDSAIMPSFQNISSSGYWSASVCLSDTRFAWYVPFSSGGTGQGTLNVGNYVRCVRGN